MFLLSVLFFHVYKHHSIFRNKGSKKFFFEYIAHINVLSFTFPSCEVNSNSNLQCVEFGREEV